MNYGIVGCGIIANIHANALHALAPEGACLYAVCDILTDKADAFAEKHGARKIYYDYGELVRDPEIDIVCVCVPSGIHGEVVEAAARAGKAIVCEKPMEIRPERILEVTKAVRECGVKMQCIFQRRLMPAAIAVRKAVREGKLGKICLAKAQLAYYRDQAYYNSAGWRGTWELDGGGSLMNQGVHGVDLITWMMNDEIDTIYGKALTLSREIAVEDTAAAVLSMKSGALCMIESATIAYPGYDTEFTIYGDKGTVCFGDEGVKAWEFIDKEDAPEKPDNMCEAVGGSKCAYDIGLTGHIYLLRDIAGAVKEDREPLIPPEEAYRAVKVITSIYESTKTGAPVEYN